MRDLTKRRSLKNTFGVQANEESQRTYCLDILRQLYRESVKMCTKAYWRVIRSRNKTLELFSQAVQDRLSLEVKSNSWVKLQWKRIAFPKNGSHALLGTE